MFYVNAFGVGVCVLTVFVVVVFVVGSTWEEVVELAKDIEEAGASIINTGIGWHEARIPTIATVVPRGGYAWVTQKMKGSLSLLSCDM